jgi:hypothetical protein
MSTVMRTYPGELTGQPFSQATERIENGIRLRHVFSFDLGGKQIAIVCDEIFTSSGVLTSIISRSDG